MSWLLPIISHFPSEMHDDIIEVNNMNTNTQVNSVKIMWRCMAVVHGRYKEWKCTSGTEQVDMQYFMQNSFCLCIMKINDYPDKCHYQHTHLQTEAILFPELFKRAVLCVTISQPRLDIINPR